MKLVEILVSVIIAVLVIAIWGTGFVRLLIRMYLAWFNPEKLQAVEMQRLEKSQRFFPRLRDTDAQINAINANFIRWRDWYRVGSIMLLVILLIAIVAIIAN